MTQHVAEPRQGTGCAVPQAFLLSGQSASFGSLQIGLSVSCGVAHVQKPVTGDPALPCLLQGYKTRIFIPTAPRKHGATRDRRRSASGIKLAANDREKQRRNGRSCTSAQIQLISLKCSFCTHTSKLRERKKNAWFLRLGRSGTFGGAVPGANASLISALWRISCAILVVVLFCSRMHTRDTTSQLVLVACLTIPSVESPHSRARAVVISTGISCQLPWAVGACVWSRRGELEDPSLKILTSRPLAFFIGAVDAGFAATKPLSSSEARFRHVAGFLLCSALLCSPALLFVHATVARISEPPARPRILLLLALGLPVSSTRIYCPTTHGTLSWPGLAPSSTSSHPLVCGLRAIISH
ncbi:hypothetical protein GGI43DRAFT_8265 [Trichoderma evansii]